MSDDADELRALAREVEEVNLHIQKLVALYADQILQEFDQRISDLELLSGQPQGAVQFSITESPDE